jgi:hypothetical protein
MCPTTVESIAKIDWSCAGLSASISWPRLAPLPSAGIMAPYPRRVCLVDPGRPVRRPRFCNDSLLARACRRVPFIIMAAILAIVIDHPALAETPALDNASTSLVAPERRQSWRRIAESFVKAVNSKNLPAALSLSGLPLMYRNQEWSDATTGDGFELGQAHDEVFSDQDGLGRFLRKLFRGLEVQETVSNPKGPPKAKFFKVELSGAPREWQALELFVFLRGFGDVEHSVLIGIDPATDRVRGVYTN